MLNRICFLLVLWFPMCAFVQGQNVLFGGTLEGGQHSCGVLFTTDSTGNGYNTPFSFACERWGISPYYSSFTEAGNGKMYTLVQGGGNYGDLDKGALVEYDLNTEKARCVLKFKGPNGSTPLGSLLLASNGKMYGLTLYGGMYDAGTLFEFDPTTEVLTVKHHFSFSSGLPRGSLIEVFPGQLFGITTEGWPGPAIFRFDINTNQYIPVHIFNPTTEGNFPHGSLIKASGGLLYGLTSAGGTFNRGVLFEFNPVTNAFVVKKHLGATNQPWEPKGSLVETSPGIFYGMSEFGGTGNDGTLFEYNVTTNILTVKYHFNAASGNQPTGNLFKASNGKLYGLTAKGGPNGGTLFEYIPASSAITVLHYFEGGRGGFEPHGTLIQASNGLLYGLTALGGFVDHSIGGGVGGSGIAFSFDIGINQFQKLFEFQQRPQGEEPYGNVEYYKGWFYGTTKWGGDDNSGVIYRYHLPTNTYEVIHHMHVDTLGYECSSGLKLAADGKMYGTTRDGGTNSAGTLFRVDPDLLTVEIIHDFNAFAEGAFPRGNITIINGTEILVALEYWGLYGSGAVVKYDVTNGQFSVVFNFPGSGSGANPVCAPLLGANNMLYGMTDYSSLNSGIAKAYSYSLTTGVYTALQTLWSPYHYPSDLFFEDLGRIVALSGASTGERVMLFDTVSNNPSAFFTFSAAATTGNLGQDLFITDDNDHIFGVNALGGPLGEGVLYEYNWPSLQFINRHNFDSIQGGYPTLISSGCVEPYIDLQPVSLSQCTTGTAVFTVGVPNAPVTYQWFKNTFPLTNSGNISGADSAQLQLLLVTAADSGYYYCRVTNSCGETYSDTVFLTISIPGGSLPAVQANVSDTLICPGDSVLFNGSGAVSYTWNHGVQNSMYFTPTQSQLYAVTGTDANGCTNYDTVEINLVMPSTLLASASSLDVCFGDSAFVYASTTGGFNHTWNNSVTDSIPFAVTSNAYYIASGTDTNGCQVYDSVYITMRVPPIVTANCSDTIVCTGFQTLVYGAGASSYIWLNGVSDSVLFTPPSGTSTYYVTGTDTYGCKGNDSINIHLIPPPQVTLTMPIDSVCYGSPVFLVTGASPPGGSFNSACMSGAYFYPTCLPGAYVIEYYGVDTNGCGNYAYDTLTVYICNGIGEGDMNTVQIYPNPTNGQLFIDFGTHSAAEITLTDNTGRMIHHTQFLGAIYQTDLTNLANGMYLLHIVVDDKRWVYKIHKTD